MRYLARRRGVESGEGRARVTVGVPVPALFPSSLSFSLSATPAKSCSSSSDYVVIGLFYEPCDAVLSNLFYNPQLYCPPPSQKELTTCAQESSLAIPVLLEALPKTTKPPCKSFPNFLRSYLIILHLAIFNLSDTSHHDSSSLFAGSHHAALPSPPPAHQLLRLLHNLPHS